jgi:hypothetical protein
LHTLSPQWRGQVNWRVQTHCITALTPLVGLTELLSGNPALP